MLFFGLCCKRGGRARYLLGARRQGKKVLGGAVGMLLNLDRVSFMTLNVVICLAEASAWRAAAGDAAEVRPTRQRYI